MRARTFCHTCLDLDDGRLRCRRRPGAFHVYARPISRTTRPSISPSFHPEEFEHAAVAVLLSEEAARVVQAFLGAQQSVLARVPIRYEHAGRLVVVVSCRR